MTTKKLDILNKINLLLEVADTDKISKLLKRDCKKFLRESKGLPVYRGIRKEFEFKKFKVRKDRRPRDIEKDLHDAINKEFEKLHGIKNVRSVSLFGSGDNFEITYYGTAYVIFPIGDYTFWWNPRIIDLWRHFKKEDIRGADYLRNDKNKLYFKEALKLYTNKDLVKAIASKNEIMFQCDYYYAITPEIYEKINL